MNGDRSVTEDDLQAYVDGVLQPAARAELEIYLEQHQDVARRIKGYVRQRAGLRAALAPYAEEAIPSRLRLADLFERRRRPSPSWRQATAAALVMFAIGGAGGWFLRPVSGPRYTDVRPLAQEAADSYAVFEPDRIRPVEIKAEHRDDLVNWVSARLRRPVSVPETAAGYRLMGGRVVATSRGPAAMFMYDKDHGARVVMLVCPMSAHGTAPITASLQGNLAGLTWSEHGMGYSIVGAISTEKLHPLAEDMRRQIDNKV